MLNVVGMVDCIDRQRSRYTTFAGRIFRLQQLQLKESATAELLLFRPVGYELLMLADEKVAAVLAGFSGVLVSPASGWSDNHVL